MSTLRRGAQLVAILALVAGAADAQLPLLFNRTYVSKLGDDANSCNSQLSPCMTITRALAQTRSGGEISVLDSTVSGPVFVNKSVTIDGTGARAGISAGGLSTSGILVAGAATDKVVLRNLSINGFGSGGFGIQATAAGQVTVESCSISGVGTGIRFALTATGTLYVTDTHITNVNIGINVSSSSGQAFANLDNVHIENVTSWGVSAITNASVTIFRSKISRGSIGVSTNHPTARVDVLSSSVGFFSGIAIHAGAPGSLIRLSNSDIMNNGTAIGMATGAVVESDGSNRVAGFDFNNPPNGVIDQQ